MKPLVLLIAPAWLICAQLKLFVKTTWTFWRGLSLFWFPCKQSLSILPVIKSTLLQKLLWIYFHWSGGTIRDRAKLTDVSRHWRCASNCRFIPRYAHSDMTPGALQVNTLFGMLSGPGWCKQGATKSKSGDFSFKSNLFGYLTKNTFLDLGWSKKV